MLRVDRSQDPSGATWLRLSGHLTGPWIGELATACKELVGATPPPVLELSELVFADLAGLQLLAQLRQEDFRLIGSSPFIAAQIAGTGQPLPNPRGS
ncbi:MAG TPA: hypothetical protein VMB21_02950 [Candidatus Limnocylindria bacterium]|nr:hypothetical protein [Candidatus Limnocylindria bacterium]